MKLAGHRQAGRRPVISVVIPTWEGSAPWLERCLAAVADQELDAAPEVLVVLDGPCPSVDAIIARVLPAARRLRRAEREGFAVAATAGLLASKGALVALLNDDAVPDPGWLAALLDAARRNPDAGSFASRVVRLDDPSTVDSAGHGLTRWGEPFNIGAGHPDGATYDVERPVFGAPASASAYRRELILDCGGFDREMGAYLEDVELSLRAQLMGFPCLYVPSARVGHRGSASYGARADRLVARNRLRLVLRSMPRNTLRAAGPAIPACIAASLLRGALGGGSGVAVLAGTIDGLRCARAALAGRSAALGGRRVPDAAIRGVLVDSERRLIELGQGGGRWRRARARLAGLLGAWIDRREERLGIG
jgi:GT2 family glycosyltransferase